MTIYVTIGTLIIRAIIDNLNASLEQVRASEQQLEQMNHMLEQRVAERTAQLEEAMAQQVAINARLRELDDMKSQFLASMSHELRTPLNAILNFTEFVSMGMMGPVNDKQRDALDKAIQSGRHLLSLINDVLDMTKIEAGMMTLFVEADVDLQAEVKTVISTAQTLLKDKPEVELILDIDPDLPPVLADKRRLRQVLLNLISNAVKFTEHGSITFSAKRQASHVLFAVIDTGVGIDPEQHGIIFEPFRQTEHGVQHVGGTGLGLPISRKLAEAHGGQLWVESESGEGAAFYFSLPIRNPALIPTLPAADKAVVAHA
jgi:signal transduction histidine kinase